MFNYQMIHDIADRGKRWNQRDVEDEGSSRQAKKPDKNQAMKSSRTMPQLHYTRQDIQEQYLVAAGGNRTSERLGTRIEQRQLTGADDNEQDENSPARASRKRSKRAQSSGPTGGQQQAGEELTSEASEGEPDNETLEGSRESRRGARKRRRRRRAQSASLFSACFTIPNIGSMITSQISSSNNNGSQQQRRSILQHLGLAGSGQQQQSTSSGKPQQQRPISASKTLGDLAGSTASVPGGAGGPNRKHVSFGQKQAHSLHNQSACQSQQKQQQQSRRQPADNNNNNVIIRNYTQEELSAGAGMSSAEFVEPAGNPSQPASIYLLGQGAENNETADQSRRQPQVIYHNRATAGKALPLPAHLDQEEQQQINSTGFHHSAGSFQAPTGARRPNQGQQQQQANQNTIYKRLPNALMRTQATQTEITAYHLMSTLPLSGASSGAFYAPGQQAPGGSAYAGTPTSASTTAGQSPATSQSSLRFKRHGDNKQADKSQANSRNQAASGLSEGCVDLRSSIRQQLPKGDYEEAETNRGSASQLSARSGIPIEGSAGVGGGGGRELDGGEVAPDWGEEELECGNLNASMLASSSNSSSSVSLEGHDSTLANAVQLASPSTSGRPDNQPLPAASIMQPPAGSDGLKLKIDNNVANTAKRRRKQPVEQIEPPSEFKDCSQRGPSFPRQPPSGLPDSEASLATTSLGLLSDGLDECDFVEEALPGSPPSLSEASSQTTDASIARQIIDIGHSLERARPFELRRGLADSSAGSSPSRTQQAEPIQPDKTDEATLTRRRVNRLATDDESTSGPTMTSARAPEKEASPKEEAEAEAEESGGEIITDNAILTVTNRSSGHNQQALEEPPEASLSDLETTSRRMSPEPQAPRPPAEQRRDDFLQLVEHDYELMEAVSALPAAMLACEDEPSSGIPPGRLASGPAAGSSRGSQRQLERSSTSTLSTRHHSYCSTDDFNPTPQQQALEEADSSPEAAGRRELTQIMAPRRRMEQEELLADEDDVIRPPDTLINSNCRPKSARGEESESEPAGQLHRPASDKRKQFGPLEPSSLATNGPDKEAVAAVAEQPEGVAEAQDDNDSDNKLETIKLDCEARFMEAGDRKIQQQTAGPNLQSASMEDEEPADMSQVGAAAAAAAEVEPATLSQTSSSRSASGKLASFRSGSSSLSSCSWTNPLALVAVGDLSSTAASVAGTDQKEEVPSGRAGRPEALEQAVDSPTLAPTQQASNKPTAMRVESETHRKSVPSGPSSPPTSVSELDQDEELSTPSFVDSYRNRLGQVCQLADSVVGELIGEYLTKRDDHQRPANHSNLSSYQQSSFKAVGPSGLNSRNSSSGSSESSSGATSGPRAGCWPERVSPYNSLSSGSLDPQKATSSGDSSSSTSVTGHSYVCCHPASQGHLNEADDLCKSSESEITSVSRPKLPEKPAHLKGAQGLLPKAEAKPEAAAAALVVATTSVGAAAAAFQEKTRLAEMMPTTSANQDARIAAKAEQEEGWQYKEGGARGQNISIREKSETSELALRTAEDTRPSSSSSSTSPSSSSSTSCSLACLAQGTGVRVSAERVTEAAANVLQATSEFVVSMAPTKCASLDTAGSLSEQPASPLTTDCEPAGSSSVCSSTTQSSTSTVAIRRRSQETSQKHRLLSEEMEDEQDPELEGLNDPEEAKEATVSAASSVTSQSGSSCSDARSSRNKHDASDSPEHKDSNALTTSEHSESELPLLDKAQNPQETLLANNERRSSQELSTVSEVSEEMSATNALVAPTSAAGGTLAQASELSVPGSDSVRCQQIDNYQPALATAAEMENDDTEIGELTLGGSQLTSAAYSEQQPEAARVSLLQGVSLEQRRRSAGSNATTGSGSISASSITRMKSPVDCPYVHDIQPLSPPAASSLSSGAGSGLRLSHQPVTPPSIGEIQHHHRQSRLSHDDTMEAIEDDVEGEEQELEQQEHQRNLAELASSIEPPPAFAGSESSNLIERVCTPSESIKEEEEEEEEDDEEEESSISISQHGVLVVTQQHTQKQTKAIDRKSSSSPPSSSSEELDQNQLTPTHNSSSFHVGPKPPPSKEELERFAIPTFAEEKQLGHFQLPSKSLSTESTTTHAILEHLSRHHPSLPPEEEPDPSLEQSRSVKPRERRESWRREAEKSSSGSKEKVPMALDESNNEVPRGATIEQEGTGTMKRRSKLDATQDQKRLSQENPPTSAGEPPKQRRGPPLSQLKASTNDPQQDQQRCKTTSDKQSHSQTDTSICSSCSCLAGSLDQPENPQPEPSSTDKQQPGSSEPSGSKQLTGNKPKLVSSSSGSAWMSLEEGSVFTENYWLSHWLYISEHEEREIWNRAIDMVSGPGSVSGSVQEAQLVDGMPSDMSELSSTQSEASFSGKYKSTTRKMIHRRATIEMYKRIMANELRKEKRVEISKSNGEFGFRIHGSRPVVVSAIERGTSAESCGLQVGDLIYAINGTNILEMAHSDVVELAHNADSTKLVLDLVPTNNFLMAAKYNPANNKRYEPLVTGFLMRLSSSTAQPLLVELQKKVAHLAGVSAQQRAAKLTEVLRLAWRQRYFILRSDNCLYWYKSPNDIEPCGGINLQGFSASLTSEFSEPSYVIRLVKYGGQPHYFGTNNICDIQTWIDAINKAATEANQNDPYMKRTLTIAHKSPNEIPEADCCGYLYKFTHKKLSGAHWRAAYFVLKDACLYLYRDQEPVDEAGKQASAVYYLHGYRVRSKHIEHKKHTFELTPPNRKTMRPMYLMANSEMDKKRWIAALEYSIDRWIEID